jgi:hypothetical protein
MSPRRRLRAADLAAEAHPEAHPKAHPESHAEVGADRLNEVAPSSERSSG